MTVAAVDPPIDLRTDVVAGPTVEMWEAMRSAELGWTYYRDEDASVRELERACAELLGKEDAVFTPTASAANLAALLTLGRRGTQAIVESNAHIVTSEAWGIAYVANLFVCVIQTPNGIVTPDSVHAAVEGRRSPGLPGTSIVCLENTHTRWGGTIMTPVQIAEVCDAAHLHGARVHLDGARLFNAAAALDLPVSRFAEAVDTVVISLNKGLCAPYGAVLAGSRRDLEEARINLTRLGAMSIHKAGLLAAAGLVAVRTMLNQVRQDNVRAGALGRLLQQVPNLRLQTDPVQTNIVLLDVAGTGCTAAEFTERLEAKGVRVMVRSQTQIRMVTHRLIGDREVTRAVEVVRQTANEFARGADVRHSMNA